MASNTPKDLAALQNQLGKDNANAIAAFVDGRISGLRDELGELIARQKDNIAAAKVEGSPEIKAAANDATRSIQAADEAVEEAKVDPTPEKAAEAKEKVDEAKEKVSKVESQLEARVGALEEVQAGHGRDIAQLKQDVSDLKESHSALQTAVARAVAIARSGDGGTLQRASRVALTVFAAVGVAYWLIWWLTPLNYEWAVNLGLALGAGGLAGWIVLVWFGGNDSSSAASAEAAAGGRHNHGLDIMRGAPAGYDAHAYGEANGGNGAQAGANANAGHGHSRAGANASAH